MGIDTRSLKFPKAAAGQSCEELKDAREARERKEEARWKREVWSRDKGLDRFTERPVRRIYALHTNRGECHHVVSRADRAVRWDRRNGLLVSHNTHVLIERNKLRVVGTKFFKKHGNAYIDCDYPVRFVPAGS